MGIATYYNFITHNLKPLFLISRSANNRLSFYVNFKIAISFHKSRNAKQNLVLKCFGTQNIFFFGIVKVGNSKR